MSKAGKAAVAAVVCTVVSVACIGLALTSVDGWDTAGLIGTVASCFAVLALSAFYWLLVETL